MIEAAKSGRASCRSCRSKIEKGDLRFGVLDYTFTDKGSYKWHHLRCAAKKLRSEVFQYLNQAGDDLKVDRAQIDAVLEGGSPAAAKDAALATLSEDDRPEWLTALHGKKGKVPEFLDPATFAVSRCASAVNSGAASDLIALMR